MPCGHIRFGVGGWQSSGWEVLGEKRGHRRTAVLTTLAEYVDVVEVDSTRDGILKPEVASLWIRQVAGNPAFRFNPVLGRRFSHDRGLRDADVSRWMEGVLALQKAGRLGCVVVEFPWAFRYSQENREFLIELRRTFHRVPLVAEFRHNSWHREEALGALIDYRVGFANLDQPEYFRGMPPTSTLVTPLGYVRLHGRRGVEWFREFQPQVAREAYRYPIGELTEWRERIEHLASHSSSLYVMATDPAEMLGLLNIIRLRALLEPEHRRAPAALLSKYWDELRDFTPDRPVQAEFTLPVQAVA